MQVLGLRVCYGRGKQPKGFEATIPGADTLSNRKVLVRAFRERTQSQHINWFQFKTLHLNG